ncbi:hypothetical protein PYW07_008250 [Mythimna separata]|uniref:RILP-like protein homolog n=1 Tax=Mythimna separata TaxID=271217 RepID=A0AAD7YCP6_MYTSE|nr:hypothetical protein PYW07_008250 [Mythimna separata]
MPYRRRFSAKMPDFDDEVTVVDVYDLASDIGKECEIIIEKYGPDAVTALLPKVINALELLENLAVRNEKENQALQELTAKISQLENDKIEKAEYRQRFEKEIEAIEEQWRTESAELVTAVARLQDENKRLRRTINAPADGSSAPPSPAREHDQEVLSRLSSTAEKQRATLRHQELQLQEKQQLIDSLSNQVEKLAQVSRDLRRKHKQIQNQMRLVCEERSELTAIVQSQQRDIAALQQDSAQNKKCPTCGVATPDGADDDDQSSKPTFSVRELRAILHERNELKLKLSRAEEQLHALQTDQQHDSGSDTSPSVSTAQAEEEEAPVQGPLPAEPDDAPWKRNSGIRKFFRKLFVESDLAVGGFQRRSLSSLARSPAPHSPHPAGAPPSTAQELQDLNLGTQEFDSWLGDKFEENEEYENGSYDERFEHDIPLQRSVSLDRGIDIFNHLQTIGSTSESLESLWTVDSEGRDSMADRYRSFEDIPASPYRARSRRASFGVETFSERDLALAVLNESYKGLGSTSGSVSPQVRKLQRCFTFAGTFDSIKDRSVENLVPKERPKLRLEIPNTRNSSSCPVSPEVNRLRNFFRSSADDVETDLSDDEDQEFEVQKPFYRSISVDSNQGEGSKVRPRRSGVQDMMTDLRRKVLIKQEFKSSENLERSRVSPELARSSLRKGSYVERSSYVKLKKNISFPGNTESNVVVPTIIISRAQSRSVAKISNTSNYVEISRNCDCRICNEGEGKYFVRSVLSKLFVKIVSCKSRKLYWDENNNLNDSEMYKCLMHVLKLMLGLWLRHLDHN